MTKKLLYIIPLHKVDVRVNEAIESIKKQTVKSDWVVVTSEKIAKKLALPVDNVITVDFKKNGSSYQVLCNAGIEYAMSNKYEWVNLLECDDLLSYKATSIFKLYSENDPEAKMWAPIVMFMDVTNPDKTHLVAMGNDACWGANVTETPGEYDFNSLLSQNFVFLNSCYIHVSVFEVVGMFKPSLKAFYDYEFILRTVYNGYVIKGIPKTTYQHTIKHNAMTALTIINALPKEEKDFWLTTCRKEYFFAEDRNVKYEG